MHAPLQLASSSSSVTHLSPRDNDMLHQRGPTFFVRLYGRNTDTLQEEVEEKRGSWKRGERKRVEREEGGEVSPLGILVSAFRKTLVACKSSEGGVEEKAFLAAMEISWPSNVKHVAHVTFDRFNGFLGLPVEFEPEVPRRPPSASIRVFGVSTESMQLSFDSRGNSVPTILLMMQSRLYAHGGLQAEGIFRINAENGQEEYVREQLNSGIIPDDIDLHCLAGLIKAWFRELPRGILDSLSPELVMEAQTEDACVHLVRLLPHTEASLLDWALNLMADVAQFEHFNKMNARNVAMVFAPNMTQMSDPLTALMYAVQVMNFLKTLIERTLREREDSVIEAGFVSKLEPSDEDVHCSASQTITKNSAEICEDDHQSTEKQPPSGNTPDSALRTMKTGNEANDFLGSTVLPDGNGSTVEEFQEEIQSTDMIRIASRAREVIVGNRRAQFRSRRAKAAQSSNSDIKKEPKRTERRPVVLVDGNPAKTSQLRIVGRVNSLPERLEAWR
ncbi:cytoskeletal protein [Lithospermum erythrorhizon]|uniref:Cytoskeletal protein n=1 Tax=Lithospermum erythrorhizon TaxID=34254 RepID=A0AAV3RV14_LITER